MSSNHLIVLNPDAKIQIDFVVDFFAKETDSACYIVNANTTAANQEVATFTTAPSTQPDILNGVTQELDDDAIIQLTSHSDPVV